MNKKLLFTLSASSLFIFSCDNLSSDSATLETNDQRYGYSFGYLMGSEIGANPNFDDFDRDAFLAGLMQGISQEEAQIPQEQMRTLAAEYQQQLIDKQNAEQEALQENNQRAADEFLANNSTVEGINSLESGVQYQVEEEGEGESPRESSTVRVHYRGSTLDGVTFDNSYERGEPAEFQLDAVIPGWRAVLLTMRPGGKAKAFIPPDQAYGISGIPGVIEPNSLLVFEIELLEVIEY